MGGVEVLEMGRVYTFTDNATFNLACNTSEEMVAYDVFVPSAFVSSNSISVVDTISKTLPLEYVARSVKSFCVDASSNVAAVLTHRRHAVPCSQFDARAITVASSSSYGIAVNVPAFCDNPVFDDSELFVPYSEVGRWAGFGIDHLVLAYVGVLCVAAHLVTKPKSLFSFAALSLIIACLLLDIVRTSIMVFSSQFSVSDAPAHKKAVVLFGCRVTLYWWTLAGLILARNNMKTVSLMVLATSSLFSLFLAVANGYLPVLLFAGVALKTFVEEDLSNKWLKQNAWNIWDAIVWVVLFVVYAVLTSVYSESVDRTCPYAWQNQNEIVNVPAAVSSIFIGAAALTQSSWIPVKLFSATLGIVSFGFWWTQCERWHDVDVFFTSVISLAVFDACLKPNGSGRTISPLSAYWTTLFFYGAILVYGIVVLSVTNFYVNMYNTTFVAGTTVLVIAMIMIVQKRRFSLKQAVLSLLILLYAGCALWVSASDRYQSRAWYQPTALGHLFAGISLYVASLEGSIFF